MIFTSYGNDSAALIQWAHEEGLSDVAVVYTDTKWATADWKLRVDVLECWVLSLGFRPFRTTSIGFKQLAREKKGFPTQRFQWCSYILKIAPGMKWLDEFDPDRRAVCVVGVRREESEDRKSFPAFLAKSANHGDRPMLAPFVDLTDEDRNAYLKRAGIEPLPHRSRECKCINAKKADIQRFTKDDIAEIEAIESEIGRPMYRPHRHMGATGIHEMVKWAHSKRGQYKPPEPPPPDPDEDLPDENLGGCEAGYCVS